MSVELQVTKWGKKIESACFNEFLEKFEENGVHEIAQDINPYHILVKDLGLNDKYILVGFHGALERKKATIPTFFFQGIAKKAEIGLIAISDPSMILSDAMELSWYLGNNINKNVTLALSSLLDKIIEKTGKKLILAGGSGGGFAALNIHNHMQLANEAISFVWNPQTDITKYNTVVTKRYFNVCVESKEELDLDYIQEKLIEKKVPYKLQDKENLKQLIFINGYDHSHLRRHVRRFINKNEENTRVFVGNWGYGHTQPDKETIVHAVSSIAKNISFDEIIEGTSKPDKPVLNFSTNFDLFSKIVNCRASIIKLGYRRMLCIETNVYDHFIGYQIFIKIKDAAKNILFKSNYLLGSDMCKLYFETSDESIDKLRGSIIEMFVEDIHGEQKIFTFEFDSVKKIHRCSLKI